MLPSVTMKFLIFAVLLSVAFVQGFEEIQFPEHLGKDITNRIIEGWPAGANQFPHQVNLKMVSSAGGISSCGGSLISRSHVLTAAHCAIGRTYIFVRLGNVNTTTPGLLLESRNFTVHPLYDPVNLFNDLAIINLGRSIPPSDNIKPIRLQTRSSVNTTWEEATVTVSGWGLTADGGSVSETLNWVNLKIISNSVCANYYGSIIINSTICAVGLNTTAQSTCSGDSGGPLIITEADSEVTQIGTVSFVSSRGCASGNPSGYVRPVFFLDWIQSIVPDITIRP